MPTKLVQVPAFETQALMQAYLVRQYDVQKAVEGAVVETLVHDRAAQAQGFPSQQAGARLEGKTAGEAGAGA